MLCWIGYSLRFTTDADWSPPPFVGSMLRGAFGTALKRTVCAMRLRACEGCPLEHTCTYTTVFETRPDPATPVMTRYDRAPHPFVLVAPITDRRGERGFTAGVRLFGDATSAAPFVLKAFEEAGERGFGASRVPHRLEAAAVETVEAGGGSGPAPAWSPGMPFIPPSPRAAPPPLPDEATVASARLCA